MGDKDNKAEKKDDSFHSEQENARLNVERLQQYEQQLKDNKRFQEYASGLRADTVERFLKDFASRKVRWTEWGNKFPTWKEKDDLQWQGRTLDMLKEIQQKKLFDLQCLWRAEKIKLRKIEIAYDFVYWEGNIMACPVLSPVTDEEAEMYLSYLESGNYQMLNGSGLWQNYKALKTAYNNEDSYYPYPEWYSFYDSRKGTSANLLLPDVRGEKEQFYIALAEKEKKKKTAEPATAPSTAAATPAINRKPSLEYYKDGFMDWFVKTFDSPETYKYFKAMDDTSEHNNEDVDEAVRLLSEAENIIPIQKNENWEHGVMWAAGELCRQKCLEIFPAVFEEYKMYIENKLEQGPLDSMMNLFFALGGLSRQAEMQKILRGRVLNGEPEDLNF